MTCPAAFTITAAPVTTTTSTATPYNNNHDSCADHQLPTPSCAGVAPASADQGATLDVTITGPNTSFVNSASPLRLFSGTGITVNSTLVISPSLLLQLLPLPVRHGACDVTVTTGSEVSDLHGGIYHNRCSGDNHDE